MKFPRLACAALLLAALGGCNKERIPFLGHWVGGFNANSSTGIESLEKVTPKGYLQLYRTNDKFLIELANQNQVLDLTGTWKIIGKRRIQLAFKDFKLTEPDLDKLKAMRRPYIDPAELRAAYSQPMVLDLSPDGKRLTGLLVHVGPLEGTHEFVSGL